MTRPPLRRRGDAPRPADPDPDLDWWKEQERKEALAASAAKARAEAERASIDKRAAQEVEAHEELSELMANLENMRAQAGDRKPPMLLAVLLGLALGAGAFVLYVGIPYPSSDSYPSSAHAPDDPAPSADPAPASVQCASAGDDCRAAVSQACLSNARRIGAGTFAADAPTPSECAAQFENYRACLVEASAASVCAD